MARFKSPKTDVSSMIAGSLETLLSPYHPARKIWRYLAEEAGGKELIERYRNGVTGATAHDPLRLIGVWTLALLDNVTSAVQVAKLCRDVVEYRWMCGDNPPGHSTLSTFRNRSGEELRLLQRRLWSVESGYSGELKGSLFTDSTTINAAGSGNNVRKVNKLIEAEKKESRISKS